MAGQGLAGFVLGAVEGDFESGEKSYWSAPPAGLNYRRAACKVGKLLLSFVRKIEFHRLTLHCSSYYCADRRDMCPKNLPLPARKARIG